jgi:magnesium transporter
MIEEKNVAAVTEELNLLLDEGKEKSIKDYFSALELSEQIYLIDHLPKEKKIQIFSLLTIEEKAELIPEVDEYSLEVLIRSLDADTLSKIADALEIDEAVDLIGEVREHRRDTVLNKSKKAKHIRALLRFGPDTAAGIMTLKFLSLNGKNSVKNAEKKIRKIREEEEFKYIYIVDDEGKLSGYVTPWTILTSAPEKILKDLAEPIYSVPADLDQEEVIPIVTDYDLLQVPVVDEFGKLIGVITVDDVLDVMEEEATEDIQYLGGLRNIESAFFPPRRSFASRIPWLYIKLATALLAALVVWSFEDVIQAFIGAAIFMPVVAAMGGSAGTQTLSIIVRAIALGEVRYQDVKGILWKEIIVGFSTGVAIGLGTSLIALIWKGSNPLFGLVVGLALILNHLAAAIFGVLLPVIMDRMDIDPALTSNLFLTTITDAFGFFALLWLTKIILT